MSSNRWMIYNKKIPKDLSDLEIPNYIKKILVNRGIDSKESINMFINGNLSDLHDPFLMADMEEGVGLVIDAIDEGKHIIIVGDYDQDGNSALVTLIKGLSKFTDKISYLIPDRIEDGYGLNNDLVDKALEFGADILITCDNGISAHGAVDYAIKKGLKVIITDHHQVSLDEEGCQILPKAHAVINPHRLDCPYPFKDLCGAGVAYKLVVGIYIALGVAVDETYDLLQYVAMGTVCDIVDLLDENRIMVKEGLKRINHTKNMGMVALLEENSWDKEVSAYTLGFVLGPCINASGRLSTARLGVELFLEDDENLVRSYAGELVRLNQERKDLTESTFKKALELVEENFLYNNHIIMLYIPEAHESIVGIVAGRIKDIFHRPTIVFAKAQDEGLLKGSGRSISTYDMYEEMSKHRELFQSFGGHKMACGLSIRVENFQIIEQSLNEDSRLTSYDLQEEISIDLQVPIENLRENFVESIEKLGPFGKANPKPVFADKELNIIAYKILGKEKNHIKLSLEKHGRVFEAISFSNADEVLSLLKYKFGEENLNTYGIERKRNLIDLVYYPKINDFRKQRTIQLNIIDIR